jgi:hypothetical protein
MEATIVANFPTYPSSIAVVSTIGISFIKDIENCFGLVLHGLLGLARHRASSSFGAYKELMYFVIPRLRAS